MTRSSSVRDAIQFSPEIHYLQKVLGFYLLLKIWLKIFVKIQVNT